MTPHAVASSRPASRATAQTTAPVKTLITVRTSMYLRNFEAISALARKTDRDISFRSRRSTIFEDADGKRQQLRQARLQPALERPDDGDDEK
jgi:hypothetical protein